MSPIAVIFGAGPNIGLSTASRLKSEGYKVAVVSRSIDVKKARSDGLFPLRLDLSKPATVADAFETIVKELGVPSVLVYNAVGYVLAPEDPFSPTLAQLEANNAINILSLYSAVQEFIKHGRTLPAGTQKTVLYTGNALNKMAISSTVVLGIGKSGGAHIIAVGAGSSLVNEGFRFYYVDQRTPEGSFVTLDALSGDGHAQVFSHLIKEKEQKAWNVTFVKPEDVEQL